MTLLRLHAYWSTNTLSSVKDRTQPLICLFVEIWCSFTANSREDENTKEEGKKAKRRKRKDNFSLRYFPYCPSGNSTCRNYGKSSWLKFSWGFHLFTFSFRSLIFSWIRCIMCSSVPYNRHLCYIFFTTTLYLTLIREFTTLRPDTDRRTLWPPCSATHLYSTQNCSLLCLLLLLCKE